MGDPVERYFSEFPGYAGGPRPGEDWRRLGSFNQLADEKHWSRPVREQEFLRLKDAQIEVVEIEINSLSTINDYQALCRQVGIPEVPESARQAYTLLSGVFVNLVDLIQLRKTGGQGSVTNYGSSGALKDYSETERKVCPVPQKRSKVLRKLLREFDQE